MSTHIKNYIDFKESVMIPKDQNTNGDKSKSKMDFRIMCSWDEITYKPPGFFSKERKIKVYYSPLRKTVLAIEPMVDGIQFKKGDHQTVVKEWVDSEPKAEISDFHIKRYRGGYGAYD